MNQEESTSQEESTLQSDQPVRHQGWIIEFDPDLKVAFDDDSGFDDESDT